MPRGDSLKRVNEARHLATEAKATAEVEAEAANAASTATEVRGEQAAEVPVDDIGPLLESPDSGWDPVQLLKEREENQRLIAELRAELTAARAGQVPGVVGFATGRPILSKALPPNYMVWLGPDPLVEDPDGGFRRSVLGTVRYQPTSDRISAVDGDGMGKEKTIARTVRTNLCLGYSRAGRQDIHFQYRCPNNHRYAGKFYAALECPEHAAWMQLTMGLDHDKNQMFAWFLQPDFRNRFDQLRRTHMRRMQEADAAVVEIVSTGVTMPSMADSHLPFQ